MRSSICSNTPNSARKKSTWPKSRWPEPSPRRNDDVDEILRRESARIGYGPDNPYTRIPEFATVAAITREDLIAWHNRTVSPNNIVLGVSGDFDPKIMEQKLRAAFRLMPKSKPF